jgi:hypothetical protein
MFLAIAFAALLAVQLNPTPSLQKSPKPALPKVTENACPFEGCQFGKWRTRDSLMLYTSWKADRKPLRGIKKGEIVTALTAVDITFEPDVIQVTAPIPQYGLKPGDMVFGYMNLGEGFFNAWFNGFWVEEFDGSGVEAPNGEGCQRKCNAKLLKAGRWEWWVKIKTKDGTVGWTKKSEKFAGKDALAGPD